MKELEEINCEVRSVIDIQHSVSNHLNNVEGDDGGSSNDSQIYNGIDSSCGGFLNDATYAWLSYGCHLVVLNVKNGESVSSWTFRGKITCVCQFPAQSGELPLLLVGLDNEATRIKDSVGLLCVFDCTASRVLRAIKMPAGVEQVCIVSGGAEWEEFNDKRPDNILVQMDGIASVVLCNLYHLMIDLQRSSWEVPDSSIIVDETSPAEIEFLTTKDSLLRNQTNKSKHMACNLLNPRIEKHIGFNREEFESTVILDEKLTNTIISSTKIGCLISGCLGRVIIWQNDGSVGWISLPVDETMVVTHLALLEPTDDPRPFYYLCVVFQDDSCMMPPLLRMFALLFERKYCDRGTNLYFNLEAEPSLKFEFELDTEDRVVNLSTIERGMNRDQIESESKRGEDSLLLISTTNRTLLFDLNQWYKEQMPQTISECKNPNSILASYDMKHRLYNMANNEIISCTYVPRSLQEFPNNSSSLSEELFYPNSLSLEWIELSLTKVTFWLARGVQAELLREMALAGPIILTQPSEMFHKCLSVGLVPFNSEVSFSSDHNAQRDMLLSLCLEQRWATFLIRCVKEWSDGSAAYLYPSFLKWGIQRASTIKTLADRLCEPLFDQSGNNIGESEVKTLRFCYQQLECLSNVVAKLPFETSNLIKQRRALKRVSMYFQVLLWFYDVGLLPESQDLEEGPLSVSLALKIPYPFEKVFALYKEKRESIKDNKGTGENEETLFIDELIVRECPALTLQWEKEAGDTCINGCYPPPSLQSLLRSYLTDCDQAELNEIECKHQITIYLLMDMVMLLQRSYPSVDQLIKYPSSFKVSPSLIKLTQAFWLLDHEDYHGFLDMTTGHLICDSDVKDWHHKLVLRTLIRNNQHKLALMYLRIRKPPLTSLQDQSALIGLSVEHGLVQSAFHCRPQSHYMQLLICFFQACKNYDKLGDILHLALDSEEEETFVKFLEDSKSEDMRLLYYLQRCRYMEANSGSFVRGNLAAPKNLHADMLNAYNATLPDVVKRFSLNMAKVNLDSGLEPRYPRPMTHNKYIQRTSNIYETVIKKAMETCQRGEKSFVPFITAPCTTLKLNDERININCVMSPKVVQKTRKRPLDETQDDEDNVMRTPDRAKRRKLLDDSEAALNAAFSTPLVKRKIASNKNTPMETPHSILKIRQLIRNSTSPTIGILQDVPDTSISERERKLSNRQIRFNMDQSSKNSSYNEISGEEMFPKLNASEENEEVFFSPTNEKSASESAVLSDSSYTCQHVYNARPRPGLRRTSVQTSTETIHESFTKDLSLRSRSSVNSDSSGLPGTLNSCSKISKVSPQTTRTCTPMLSSSIYSPAILSFDSSFEMTAPLKRSSETDLRRSLIFSKQQGRNDNCVDSPTPFIKNTISEESRCDGEEPMNVEENVELEVSYTSIQETSETLYKSNHLQLNHSDNPREDVQSKYKNGDVLKDETLESQTHWQENSSHRENAEGEEVFESSYNAAKNNSVLSENRECRFWSLRENAKNEPASDFQERVDLKNGEHFDITDDESSNSTDGMNLVFDDSNDKVEHDMQTVPMQIDNVYDVSNITDDESDCSTEADKPEQKSIVTSDMQRSVRRESRYSIKIIEDVEERKISEESVDNNNFSMKEVTEKSSHDSPERVNVTVKDNVNTSSLDTESPNVTSRMTRSRRASSVTKEVLSTPPPTPSKIAGRTARSRRASSLVKEVLMASIATVDEGIKRTISSESEDSSGTSSPQRTRGKRASTVARDVPPVRTEEGESKVPVRRSTRRATSVQKELPEITKPLTKSSRVSLSSSSVVETEEENVQVESKSAKTRNVSGGGKRSNVALSKTTKDSNTSEQEVEETGNVKGTRRRGSSVPKESTDAVRTRRSNSVAKEIIPEDLESPPETTKGRHSLVTTVNSPAANTRSRRSSIQSIPEELEEILNVPSKERTSTRSSKRQTAQNSRQRRAASVELPQADTKKRTRSLRGKGIIEETIEEEVFFETGDRANAMASNTKKVPTRRKRATSEIPVLEVDEISSKPRRGRKTSTKEEIDGQFSFSQPEKTDDPPSDQKAIGEVPNYVFSPPHTRSKVITTDQHREYKVLFPF